MTVKKLKEKIGVPFADFILGKVFSRKLTVFVVSTVLIFQDKLESGDFVWIATVYITVQGGYDYLKEWKKSNKPFNHFNPDNDVD